MESNTFKEIFNNPIYDQINNMVRWNGTSRIKEETVGHHTHIVTFFTRIILESIFSEITKGHKHVIISESLTYAIFHDFDESFTGDIIHGFKHNKYNGKDIRENIEDYLIFVKEKYFNENTPLNKLMQIYCFNNKELQKYKKMIVKLSDWLSMLFYIQKEQRLGNRNLEQQFQYCIENTKKHSLELIEELKNCGEFKMKDLNFDILEEISQTNFYK